MEKCKYCENTHVLEKEFADEIHSRGTKIDPHDNYCFLSLTIGWALAKGLSIEDSTCFAIHIRYDTDLG